MATLADVWSSLFPSATPVAPLDRASRAREVGWARLLKARVPAFDALEAGDLAIVPGGALAAVAPGPPEAAALVAEFVRARVGALLLIEADGGSGNSALAALGTAAAAAGIPAFRGARLDPAAVERSAIGFLVNRRAELDRQAALLEARLEALALEGSDLTGLVGAIGGFLERAVALEGRRGDALAVHAPVALAGAAGAVQAYLANPRTVALRVPLPAAPPPPAEPGTSSEPGVPPVTRGGSPLAAGPSAESHPAVTRGRAGDGGPEPGAGAGRSPARPRGRRTAGSLALLGERPVSELERVVSERIAALLALEIARDESVRRARDTTRRSDALPADGPPWAVLLADRAQPGAAPSLDQREELRREIRLLAPARRLALRGDAESLELRIVLAAGDADPGALDLAGRIARFLGRTVALSRSFADPADRPAAEAEARATLEAARLLVDPPAIARGERAAAYRLLGGLHNIPDGSRQARALLEPVLHGRRDVRGERLATLRAVLDHPGLGEAAAALGVHRNTVAYRVRRIEAATGWSLDDADFRLALGIALRIVQSAQE